MKKILLEDIAELKFLAAPTLNPSGTLLAYALTSSERKSNSYCTDIYLLDTASGESRPLNNAGKDKAFFWEDDETLLVRAAYSEADECKAYAPFASYYRVNVKSGEKEKAFHVPGDVAQLKKIGGTLYAATVVIDRNAPDPATTPEDECEEYLDYHIVEEAPLWENGLGFVAGKRTVLHIFDAATGTLKQVSNDTTEVKDFTVSNGRIAFIGRDWKDTLQDRLSELYLYDVNADQLTTIIAKDSAKVGRVAFVGEQLLYTLSDNRSYGDSQLCDFYCYDIASGESRFLAPHNGLAVGGGIVSDVGYGRGNVWKAVGDRVLFAALSGFERALYSIDLTGCIRRCTALEGGSVEFFDANDKDAFLGCLAQDDAVNLYRVCGDTLTKVTDVNAEYFEDRFVSLPEYIPFANSAGISVDGWVIYPMDYDPAKQYPAVFEIHGGPRAAYSTVFVHEMQVFASKGYFVFFCNPRGSEGRGEEFADIRGKHGTIDYDDLMEFTDHVLAAYPQIDPKRVAAAGGSYAGFMCNWIVGHTDRFAAIASQRSVSDFVADYCISDLGFTYDREACCGNPWDDTEKLWFHSPYKYAPYAKTPILFIHALEDYDCTIDQGVMMFQAMKYFGVPSRMCLFEGENHELSRSGKPRHRIRRLKEITAWIDKYLT
ncbi:MAG: S9 family peptidase [Ruminococcaceae bacterium]|nr:S9 family peptidase [Oscillospiraceae bacterium]